VPSELCWRFIQAQKTGGIPVEGNFVVFSYASDDRIDILRGFAKYECVINVDDDVGSFGCGCPVEKAVVECGHVISLGEESGLIVLVKDLAGVG